MAVNRQQERLKELTDKLEQGVTEIFESERYMDYLKVMSRFHNYSYRNTLLITLQDPNATMVAGYSSWQKNFGRQVNKGEKAIHILSPAPYRTKQEMEVIDQESQMPVRNQDGSVMTEEVEVTIPAFRVSNVFDVNQTSGRPIPTLFDNIEGDVNGFADFMRAMETVSPVPIGYEPMEDKDGYYHQVEKRVALREGMSQRQTIAAVIHEVSHAKLHALDVERLKESAIERNKDQNTMEVEAESISYVVSQRFGIETGANSFGYIASWSKNRQLPELHASLKIIRDTASDLISGIDTELERIRKEREIQEQESHVFSEQDMVVKFTREDGNSYRYAVVTNMERRDIIANLQVSFSQKLEDAESFLIDQGAIVIPWYDSDGYMRDSIMDFYDLEYDYDSGITHAKDLSVMQQATLMINRAEYGHSWFNEEQKNLIVNYAFKLDNLEDTQKLIMELKETMEAPAFDAVYDVMDIARAEIEDLPDPTIGLSEMREYGYRYSEMLPLNKERALELFQDGVEIFMLGSDNTESIVDEEGQLLNYDGIFGVEKAAYEKWRMPEESEHTEFLYPQMMPLSREEALEVYALGMTVYHVTEELLPPTVKERAEMETGEPYYQISLEDGEHYRELKDKMKEQPEIESLQEAQLLFGQDNRFGIYQIRDGSKGREYSFMSKDFVDSHGMTIERNDYQLMYTGILNQRESLEDIYERFNINRPDDFRGHSMSVSDVVVTQKDGEVQSHYVDSFGYTQLPDFIRKQPELEELLNEMEEAAFQVGDRYLAVQTATEGFDYTFFEADYREWDGGVYDNPDLSFGEAVKEILEGEDLSLHDCKLIDYDELMEKTEAVNTIQTEQPLKMTSENDISDKKLNNLSREEIELMVLADAQSLIDEENLDISLHGIRVYGSRTREGLFQNDSDVDVVVSYSGDIAEDSFFNLLNEAGLSMGGMKLDINPIHREKSGTLEEYLERSEKYLDEQERIRNSKDRSMDDVYTRRDKSTLAKVEEQLEQNYNMIDDVINNEPEKSKATIEFYAAECEEYHNLKPFYDGMTLEEAVEKYKEILDDPRKSYAGNGMGFILHDEALEDYSDTAYPLVMGTVICGNMLDVVQPYLVHPLVRESLERVRELFPDFEYRAPMEIKEAYYAEKMTAEELAEAVFAMAEAVDDYALRERILDRDLFIDTAKWDMITGNTKVYERFLKGVVDSETEQSEKAEVLLERMSAYEPDLSDMEKEPMVCIRFSEAEEFAKESYFPLSKLDEKVSQMDYAMAVHAKGESVEAEETFRLQFTVYYTENQNLQKLDGKMNIGDGDGGIIGSMKSQVEARLTDEAWLSYAKSRGEENYQIYVTELQDQQDHVLPYLQTFCSLQEHAQITTPEQKVEKSTASGREASNVQEKGGAVKKTQPTKVSNKEKLSIHERLEINKAKLANQKNGQIGREGVELA